MPYISSFKFHCVNCRRMIRLCFLFPIKLVCTKVTKVTNVTKVTKVTKIEHYQNFSTFTISEKPEKQINRELFPLHFPNPYTKTFMVSVNQKPCLCFVNKYCL